MTDQDIQEARDLGRSHAVSGTGYYGDAFVEHIDLALAYDQGYASGKRRRARLADAADKDTVTIMRACGAL